MIKGDRWYVYMLECTDGSLYTGVTSNVVRRLAEHLGQGSHAARYTRSHEVVRLAMLWHACGKSEALSLEWHIHHSPRNVKEELLKRPASANTLFGAKPGERRYATVPVNWRNAYWARAKSCVLRNNNPAG